MESLKQILKQAVMKRKCSDIVWTIQCCWAPAHCAEKALEWFQTKPHGLLKKDYCSGNSFESQRLNSATCSILKQIPYSFKYKSLYSINGTAVKTEDAGNGRAHPYEFS